MDNWAELKKAASPVSLGLIFIKLLCELWFDLVDLVNVCGRGQTQSLSGCRWATLKEAGEAVRL